MMDLIASISVKIQHSSRVYCPALWSCPSHEGFFERQATPQMAPWKKEADCKETKGKGQDGGGGGGRKP